MITEENTNEDTLLYNKKSNIMNYEKKYNEALENIRKGLQTKEDGTKISGVTKAFLEEVFPELKESEDEIRKQIISFLKEFECDHYRNLDFKSWISWLENQGEQKAS